MYFSLLTVIKEKVYRVRLQKIIMYNWGNVSSHFSRSYNNLYYCVVIWSVCVFLWLCFGEKYTEGEIAGELI